LVTVSHAEALIFGAAIDHGAKENDDSLTEE
jgi:hypothetical protein